MAWLVHAWSGSPGVDAVVTALVLAASRRSVSAPRHDRTDPSATRSVRACGEEQELPEPWLGTCVCAIAVLRRHARPSAAMRRAVARPDIGRASITCSVVLRLSRVVQSGHQDEPSGGLPLAEPKRARPAQLCARPGSAPRYSTQASKHSAACSTDSSQQPAPCRMAPDLALGSRTVALAMPVESHPEELSR